MAAHIVGHVVAVQKDDEMGAVWLTLDSGESVVIREEANPGSTTEDTFRYMSGIIGAGEIEFRADWVQPEPDPKIVKTGKAFTDAMRGRNPRNGEYWVSGDVVFNEMGSLMVTAESEKALDTALSSSKTLIQLNALATESDYKYAPDRVCRVATNLDAMIEERGENIRAMSKDAKSRARKAVKDEILSLAGVSWTFEDEGGNFVRVPLAGGECSVVRGKVLFVFSAEFMRAVLGRNAGRLALDPSLLKVDERRHPHAMAIGYKLAAQSYMNIGGGNECTLSVSSLLDFVASIPTYEEVKASDRAYTRRMIEPMERDLDYLVEIGFLDYWDYCHSKGEPLTDEEQDARFTSKDGGALPYDIAANALIQWKLAKTYEEQRAETVKSRERKAELAEAARQRNAERQKRIERKIETQIAKKAAGKAEG